MKLLLLGVAALAVAMPHARALEPGDAPPPIGMVDQRGEKVDLSDLEGKVVLVDFWASWCGPCREEMPVLEQLSAKYADQGLVIVGVNIDRNKKKMISFSPRSARQSEVVARVPIVTCYAAPSPCRVTPRPSRHRLLRRRTARDGEHSERGRRQT